MTAIKKILVPTDFSDASAAAVHYACGLAESLGASVSILHVIVNPYMPGGYYEYLVPPLEYYEQAELEALKKLEGVLTEEERTKYSATLVHRTGSPAHEILDYLDQHRDIDLVVMSTHGRGAVSRLMLGSVVDKVLRAAPCAVLTIRVGERRGHGKQAA